MAPSQSNARAGMVQPARSWPDRSVMEPMGLRDRVPGFSPAGRCDLAFALGRDGGLATFKIILGRHIAGGAAQALPIIIHCRPVDRLASISQWEGYPWSDALPVQRIVHAGHAALPDEPLKVPGTICGRVAWTRSMIALETIAPRAVRPTTSSLMC
jgi:hypothetical protein